MQAQKQNKYKYFSLASIKLRLWRKESKIKQLALNQMLGVSRQAFNTYMTGKTKPNKDRIKKISILTNGYVKENDWLEKVEKVEGKVNGNNF